MARTRFGRLAAASVLAVSLSLNPVPAAAGATPCPPGCGRAAWSAAYNSSSVGPGPYVSASALAMVPGSAPAQDEVRAAVQRKSSLAGLAAAIKDIETQAQTIDNAFRFKVVSPGSSMIRLYNVTVRYEPLGGTALAHASKPYIVEPVSCRGVCPAGRAPAHASKPYIVEQYVSWAGSARQVRAVVAAAIAAGASTVSVGPPCCAASPVTGVTDAAVATAISRATVRAEAAAKAAAKASGLTPSALIGVMVGSPQVVSGGSGAGPMDSVQVTVRYAVVGGSGQ